MTIKKISALTCMVLLMGMLVATTAFAATDTASITQDQTLWQNANTQWATLTDTQKAEIYSLKESALEAETSMIDNYLSWGLIDQATATQMKTNLSDQLEKMKTEQIMPMIGQGHRGGGDGLKGPTLTDEQKAEMIAQCQSRIAQDLADGKITQEQADQMNTDLENGQMPKGGRGLGQAPRESVETAES